MVASKNYTGVKNEKLEKMFWFSWRGGRKSGLSFATFAICAIILLAVPLQISCSDSGDDNGDSNPRETKPDPVKAALAEGVTYENVGKLMIAVPGKEFSILATEVTQELYESVMGENPSKFNGEKNLPVENVSWYDAVYFCNKLSAKCGLTPVYAVDGETDVEKWGYAPHITGTVSQNGNNNGYRLPTVEEWQYAAKGGQEFKYSGSANFEEKTHPVAQKNSNVYGLYDMSGNVWEWCWDSDPDNSYRRCSCGGSWYYGADDCEVDNKNWYYASDAGRNLGFRIVRSTGK